VVRHGGTVLSAEDRFTGETDVELSGNGREETRRLAEKLSQEKISAVYGSPLVEPSRPGGWKCFSALQTALPSRY
jgi:broad specificity phosphatase PhoE